MVLGSVINIFMVILEILECISVLFFFFKEKDDGEVEFYRALKGRG